MWTISDFTEIIMGKLRKKARLRRKWNAKVFDKKCKFFMTDHIIDDLLKEV